MRTVPWGVRGAPLSSWGACPGGGSPLKYSTLWSSYPHRFHVNFRSIFGSISGPFGVPLGEPLRSNMGQKSTSKMISEKRSSFWSIWEGPMGRKNVCGIRLLVMFKNSPSWLPAPFLAFCGAILGAMWELCWAFGASKNASTNFQKKVEIIYSDSE